MKFSIRAFVVSAILVVLGIFTSILINYATTDIPKVIKDHPAYIWYGIALTAFVTILLSLPSMNKKKSVRLGGRSIIKSEDIEKMKPLAADIFISYSSKDRDWVLNVLKTRLMNHGFSVITDTDFKAGSMSIDEMAKAVETTRHTIAVLTPDFVSSKWTKLETAMAQTLDPDANNRKLIPVLLQDCDIPLRIRILHYRDMRNDSGWDELVEDLL